MVFRKEARGGAHHFRVPEKRGRRRARPFVVWMAVFRKTGKQRRHWRNETKHLRAFGGAAALWGGVGGGIIIDGKMLVGSNGAGGEIGHLCVNYEETDQCGCGNRGCLEQYASATGIVRLARQKLGQEMRPTILNKQDVTAKDVFDAVKAGDEVAKEIATAFGRYLGYGLANLAVVADPAVFVIGGGVSKAGEVLIPYIREPYMERAFFANKNVRFVLAKLGNDAGICGAAKLVLDNE